jgi:hypothetical protein
MSETKSPPDIASGIFQAEIRTDYASRYLQQLCKHWSHRFAVEYDASRGVVEFKGTRCTFDARPQHLLLSVTGADQVALPALCDVVTEHLKRFAFRENIDVRWREIGGG